MKKGIFLFISLTMAVCVFESCKSKEEKAAELIKNELSKTLYDFDSYQPIETIVSVAKNNAYNDTSCWEKASLLGYGFSKLDEYFDDATEAREHMNIWGRPSYYSSTYSDNQYYKYRNEFKEAVANIDRSITIINYIAHELSDSIAKLDTTKVVGWEVLHDFRCKTRGGSPEIGHYRYVISKDFKTILLREDTESEKDNNTRAAMESVLDGWTDLEPLNL